MLGHLARYYWNNLPPPPPPKQCWDLTLQHRFQQKYCLSASSNIVWGGGGWYAPIVTPKSQLYLEYMIIGQVSQLLLTCIVWKWVFERDQVCGLLVDEKRGFLWELLFGKQEEHICEQYTRNFNCRTFRIVILEYGYGKGATGVYQEKDRQMNTMQISESG